MRGGYRPRLSKAAWLRAIILMVLAAEGQPMTAPAICFRLMIDADAVNSELRVLMEFGAVARKPGHARRWLYSPSGITLAGLAEFKADSWAA